MDDACYCVWPPPHPTDLVGVQSYSPACPPSFPPYSPSQPVPGMAHRLVFLNHTAPEGGGGAGDGSRSNPHEAVLAVRLAAHLLANGILAEDIALLTMYAGQVRAIKDATVALVRAAGVGGAHRAPPHRVTSIRCTTVDNFQGEEARVIILSLVRSAPRGGGGDGRIGFTGVANRVCVALSRAKHGMYVLGNFGVLRAASPLWDSVCRELLALPAAGGAALSPSFRLACAIHPPPRGTAPAEASTPADFDRHAPMGGCSQPCLQRQACGHVCRLICHATPHDPAACSSKKCDRAVCGHPCPLPCAVPCAPCAVVDCAVELPCGHECTAPCGSHATPDAHPPCAAVVEVTVHGCARLDGAGDGRQHSVPMACADAEAAEEEAAVRLSMGLSPPACVQPCGTYLECGHACPARCDTCWAPADGAGGSDGPPNHPACNKQCSRLLVCGHTCSSQHPCKEACPPCGTVRCPLVCPHASCPLPCADMCVPCAEQCAWSCTHQGACAAKCSAPCTRGPCDHPCMGLNPRECGHPCMGVCGELVCPSLCSVCAVGGGSDEAGGAAPGWTDCLTRESLREMEPGTRLLQLGCGHIVGCELMDGHVASFKAGAGGGEEEGEPENHQIRVPTCPECRGPLGGVLRYAAAVRACQAEVDEVKKLTDCSFITTRLQALLGAPVHARTRRAITAFEALLERVVARPRPAGNSSLKIWLRGQHTAHLARVRWVAAAAGQPQPQQPIGVAAAPGPLTEEAILRAVDAMLALDRGVPLLIPAAGGGVGPRGVIIDPHVNRMRLDGAMLGAGAAVSLAAAAQARLFVGGDVDALRARAAALWAKARGYTRPGDTEMLARIDAACDGHATRWATDSMVAQVGAGHAYKCPNGHVYFIGECGGAMEVSRCIECSAGVGGGRHQLLGSNTHAGDVDGSAGAAWDTGAAGLEAALAQLRAEPGWEGAQ